jgi:hypothetical protein
MNRRWLAVVVGGLWTSPNTFLGLLLGSVGLLCGARCTVGEGAVVFMDYPWGPGGALTLGQTILVRRADLDMHCRTYACRAAGVDDERAQWVRLGDHERAHVYQYLLFGPLFLPLYVICGGISARNPFERAADRYALKLGGWWPWGLTRRA